MVGLMPAVAFCYAASAEPRSARRSEFSWSLSAPDADDHHKFVTPNAGLIYAAKHAEAGVAVV
jgi:hypothetical protein